MFIVDSIVFICFRGIPGTNKPETVYFLKPFTMYEHLIVLKYMFQWKISLKIISINWLP